jgi:ADP-heptose:LPS heptosyltransferase
VIQLCRLGDILQTTPALRALRRMHPQAHVTLMLLDGFAAAPLPPALYDDRLLFPFDGISSLLTKVPERWGEAVSRVRAFVDGLGAEPFDRTLNLTGSELSNLLATVIPSADVQGGLVAPDRTRIVRGPWMTYFWSSLRARAQGCFNLVDVLTRVTGAPGDRRGLEIDVPPAARERAGAWLSERQANAEALIGVQLGASDERKRWPPELVAAALNRLPDGFGRIVFVGSAGERPLVARARAHLRRASLDASGETTIQELAALLGRCRLLLTNDTGTMHVAAAVGTRIVDLSTGPVYVHETGPYGEGHLAVEPSIGCFPCAAGSTCSHLSCRADFTPDDIASVLCFAAGDAADVPRLPRARLLRARFAASGRLEYVTLSSPATSQSERVRQAMATMWEHTLPVAGGDTAPIDAPPAEGAGAADQSLLEALDRLQREAGKAAGLAARLPALSASDQQAAAERLEAHRREMALVAQLAPHCAPIVSYLDVALESAADPVLSRVAGIYAHELRAAARRARLLGTLLAGASAAEFARPAIATRA